MAQFYESKDASGLAATLDHNAVSGSDLLAFGGWQEAQTELRLTPFAAKKAISLRGAFLGMSGFAAFAHVCVYWARRSKLYVADVPCYVIRLMF